MSKIIEVDIPGFGKRYCSENTIYNIINKNIAHNIHNDFFYFYNKKNLSEHDQEHWYHHERHNEYGPAFEDKGGSFSYWINGKLHRLEGPAIYYSKDNIKKYYIDDKFIGYTEEEFILYKNKYLLIG